MFWEEIIDELKKGVDPKDFRVPFTNGSEILKKIEDKYIVKKNSNYSLSNWAGRLKNKEKIKEILFLHLENELQKLDHKTNYWVVLAGKKADAKNMVYDCKPSTMLKLVQRWPDDFFIADKKYNWIAYFEKTSETDLSVIIQKE